MFNTIVSRQERSPLVRLGTVVLSASAHVAVLAGLVLSTMFVTGTLPQPPDMMAFVVSAPPPPPPPLPPVQKTPPPPEHVTRPAAPPAPIVTTPQVAAPVEAPAVIAPESGREAEVFAPVDAGLARGPEGGVAGGIAGGVDLAPPPAPPETVRVGGSVSAPRLVRRVEPDYPSIAQNAQMEGLVILEATVNERGRVDGVKVLRSHSVFDEAAVTAVKQWQYEPLVFNGQRTPFVLTVTLSFSLTR